MRLRNLAAGFAALAMVLMPATAAQAETIDVEAWAKEHKAVIKVFTGVDVGQCKGLEGLTFDRAEALAKAKDVDLKALTNKSNPEAMLEYVANSGLTLDDLTAMFKSFCGKDAVAAPVVTPDEEPDIPEPAATPSKGADDPEPVEECKPDQDLLALVDALPVADEMNSGYDRGSFAYESRDAVLAQEKRDDGTWFSLWDATVHESADTLQVDHTVALAEAWGSGAHAWTDAERVGYANDVDNPFVLNAITSELNSEKGANDPFDWMPDTNRAEYVKQWASVKMAYGLTVDGEEKMRLHAAAAEVCGDATVPDAQKDLGEAQEEVGTPGGSMAETGAGGPHPIFLIGAGLMAIGSGGALVLLRRKGIL